MRLANKTTPKEYKTALATREISFDVYFEDHHTVIFTNKNTVYMKDILELRSETFDTWEEAHTEAIQLISKG